MTFGRQRLMCGDCRNPEHVAKLLGHAVPDLMFTSPPYLNQRDYHAPIEDWASMMVEATLAPKLAEDAQIFVNLGQVHQDSEWVPYWEPWLQQVRTHGWRRFQLHIWDKKHGLPGAYVGRLQPSFEYIFHLNKKARKPNRTMPVVSVGRRNKFYNMRGADGVPAEHRGVSNRPFASHKVPRDVFVALRAQAGGAATDHPATMPIGLAEQVINAYATPKSAVYEPFCGSGTTLVAAHGLGLAGFGMELSPKYCQLAADRLAQVMA